MAETHGGAETHEARLRKLAEWVVTFAADNEHRRVSVEACVAGADALAALSASSARVAALEAALKRLEWSSGSLIQGQCPACEGCEPYPADYESTQGHRPNCWLAAALGEPRP